MLALLMTKFKYDKQMLPIILVMTVMAVGLTYVFGVGFNQQYKPTVYVVDEVQTDASSLLVEQLKQSDNFYFEEVSLVEGLALLGQKTGLSLLQISEELTLYAVDESSDYYALKSLVLAESSRVMGAHAFVSLLDAKVTVDDMLFERLMSQEGYFEVKASTLSDRAAYDNLTHIYIGYIVFFSMFSVVFTIGSIVEEKKQKIWHRELVSPLSHRQILAANLINGVIVGYSQVLLILFLGKYLMGINLGSLPGILLTLFAYVLAMNGLGLLLSSIIHTPQQLGAIAPVVIVSTSMLGGTMWPLEIITSKILLFIANLMPQKWAMDGLKAMIVGGGNFKDLLIPTTVLIGMAILFFFVSLIPYKRISL